MQHAVNIRWSHFEPYYVLRQAPTDPPTAVSAALHLLMEAIATTFGASTGVCYMPHHDDLKAILQVGRIVEDLMMPAATSIPQSCPFVVSIEGSEMQPPPTKSTLCLKRINRMQQGSPSTLKQKKCP